MSNPLDKMADNAKELGLDYEPATYTFKSTSEPIIAAFDMKPNHNMTFHNQDGKHVGTLDFNGPEMVFTGDADESAKVFFEFIANAFRLRLEQERADEREKCEGAAAQAAREAIVFAMDAEREACAKVCERKAETMAITGKSCDPDDLAAAIRARGNT